MDGGMIAPKMEFELSESYYILRPASTVICFRPWQLVGPPLTSRILTKMLLERVTWVSSSLLGLVLLAFGSFGVSSAAELKSLHAQNLLVESMDFMDKIYDRDAGYLYYFYYPLAAGQHETRSSMWYATGLLQRNRGDDVDQAVRIIKNIIGDQEKNETLQWFGDYTVYPEQPTVGHGDYKPVVSHCLLP